jgi:hypothetical protein
MRWVLSLDVRHDAGDHDVALHLAHAEQPARNSSTSVRIAGTLLLCAPLLWAIGQSVLRAANGSGPASSGLDPAIVRVWALAGPVVALGLNLWWSGRARTRRVGDRAVVRTFSLTLDPVSVALIALAGILAVGFYGHLAADAWACANGLRSAC